MNYKNMWYKFIVEIIRNFIFSPLYLKFHVEQLFWNKNQHFVLESDRYHFLKPIPIIVVKYRLIYRSVSILYT